MEAFIYKIESDASGLVYKINEHCSFLFSEGSLSYTFDFKHPVKDLWAVPVVHSDIQFIEDNYPQVIEVVGVDLKEIKILTEDWFQE